MRRADPGAGLQRLRPELDASQRLLRPSAELADEASRTTFSLRKSLFRALDGTAAESETPEYAQIRTHLQSVAHIHPHWETCYLLKKRPDGSVYFLDDIDLNREFEIAEHGEVYADCPPEMAAIFESGRAVVHGPYRDVFGEWITAADPILDPSTGEVLAVLGINISVPSMRAHLVGGPASSPWRISRRSC